MAEKRYAVVTGSNKGIGQEICRQLASNGISVILTARDELRGKEATENLKASGLIDVVFHQLDVKDPDSISSLAKFIQTNFGKLDILVNNAALYGLTVHWGAINALRLAGHKVIDKNAHLLKGIMEQTYEEAEECLKVNYYGTKRVTEALLPLLERSQSARIVNVSSKAGSLEFIKKENVKADLQNVGELTVEKLDDIVQRFLRDFKEHKLQANGWPITYSAYKVSKVVVNAYTRLIASKHPSFRVNCVHPGFVKTDMTSNYGILTPEEGARAPVMLALLPDDGPSGVYFDEMNVSSF